LFILGTSGEVFPVRTEANATDVEITILINRLILKSSYVLTSGHVEDLSRSVTSCSNVFAIPTESHAADNTVVQQVVDELNVQDPLDFGIKDCVPIGAFAFLSSR
jgi:hypothetical protein